MANKNKGLMTQENRNPIKLHPIFWIAIGAGIALIIVTIVTTLLLPKLIVAQAPTASPTPWPTLAGVASATAIPTFTPSPTLSPSPTPTPTQTPIPSQTPTPTQTDTPTLTPSATPTPLPVVRADKDARLYLGPGTDYPEQGWLVKGKTALIISQLDDGEWWYVETERGIRGWAQAGRVTAENDLSAVPVVTPLPYGSIPSSPAVPPAPAPGPVIGPLELAEVWPVNVVGCGGGFKLDVWMRAKGGTGVYTYLVNDEIMADGVIDDGATVRLATADGAWVGNLSVISGNARVDREMYFAPADYCD